MVVSSWVWVWEPWVWGVERRVVVVVAVRV